MLLFILIGHPESIHDVAWEDIGNDLHISVDMAGVNIIQCDPSPSPSKPVKPLSQSPILATPSLPQKSRKRKHIRSSYGNIFYSICILCKSRC